MAVVGHHGIADATQPGRDHNRLRRSARLGASTLFVELSLREHEGAARYYARKRAKASPLNLADMLCMEYPELAREDALKIVFNVLSPESQGDDLYSDDAIREKEDEVRVQYPARIDADVGSVVRFEGKLYSVVNITEADDGRFEYRLKR